MKFGDIGAKVKNLIKKAGTKGLVAAIAVLVLGCAVTLNFILTSDDPKDEGSKQMSIDLKNQTPEENIEVSDIENYFASISLQRKQARDEAVEVLKTVTQSDTAIEEAKQAAMTDIAKIAEVIEAEANIESLITSKGFEQCVAVISDDTCSIVVRSTGLLPGQVAQISEIVYEQTGILPENIKIIEKA